MFQALGLSIGATNLAATYDGHAAVRASEVTLHGVRLTDFVDRVGDPVPLVAPDCSNHRPEVLLAEALGAVAQSVTAGERVSEMAVTVPAHWRPSVVDALRRTLRPGVPVVSDATAALTALSAGPGLPSRGVIVLCDFGGSGTNITLANASSNCAVVGETVRITDFSGDQIDRALLGHVMSGLPETDDPSGTAMVGSLTALRDECRRAKERLSAQTAVGLRVGLPGQHTEVRVTRTELDDLTGPLFTDFLAALDDTLERYGIPAAGISAVATVGGGARIPLVTQRLSEHLRAPVVTTAQPHLTAAEGAAVVAQRSRVTDLATTVTPAPAMTAATTAVDTDQPATTMAALAWSDDHEEAELPYSRPEVHFRHDEPVEDDATPRRAPVVLFALSATAVALTAAVFGVMQLAGGTTPVEAATTVAPSPVPAAPAPSPATPAPQATQVTTVVVKPVQRASVLPRPQAPVTTQQAPAPPPEAPPPPPTTTEPPLPPPWTPPIWTPPTWTPPWQVPSSPSSPPAEPPAAEPPANPQSGDGETKAGTPDTDSSASSETPANAPVKGS